MRARAVPTNWCFTTCRWYQTCSKKYNFVSSTATTHTHTQGPNLFFQKIKILHNFFKKILKNFEKNLFFFWKFRKTTFFRHFMSFAEAKPPHGSRARARARCWGNTEEHCFEQVAALQEAEDELTTFSPRNAGLHDFTCFYIFGAKNVKKM